MIVHGFQFYNELDLLILKLEELWDVVDQFILVEAWTTFSGLPKPLWFESQKERFSKYEAKLSAFVVTLPEGMDYADHWRRERFQRESILTIFDGMYTPDDVLIIADLDEIPSADSVRRWQRGETHHQLSSLDMTLSYYYMNMVSDTRWTAGKIGRRADYTRPLTDIRYDPTYPLLLNAGWHMSFLGNTTTIQNKIRAYAHQELLPFAGEQHIDSCRENGYDLFQRREYTFEAVPLDATFPKYLQHHPEQFASYLYQKAKP